MGRMAQMLKLKEETFASSAEHGHSRIEGHRVELVDAESGVTVMSVVKTKELFKKSMDNAEELGLDWSNSDWALWAEWFNWYLPHDDPNPELQKMLFKGLIDTVKIAESVAAKADEEITKLVLGEDEEKKGP